MARPVTDIRNLGPVAAESLAKVGVTTADQVEALGPDRTYLKFLEVGDTPHFMAFAALVKGMQDKKWNDFAPGERDALLARFEGLKAQHRSNK